MHFGMLIGTPEPQIAICPVSDQGIGFFGRGERASQVPEEQPGPDRKEAWREGKKEGK